MAIVLALSATFGLSIVAPWVARGLGRFAGWGLAAVPAAITLWLLSIAPSIVAGDPVRGRIEWAPRLGLDLAFSIDGLGLLFGLLIAGVGGARPRLRPRLPRPARRHAAPDGVPASLHGRDAWRRVEREPARALRLLGTDERQFVPPDRLRPRSPRRPQGRAAGAPRHRAEAGSACWSRSFCSASRAAPTSSTRSSRTARRCSRVRCSRRSSSSCASARSRSRRSFHSTSGFPARWKRRHRSARTCTARPW